VNAIDPRDPKAPPVEAGVVEISTTVIRILAPNPSPMTLDGTNTYLVADTGRSRVVVIDPGPVVAEHLSAMVHEIRSRQLEVQAVITTHAHPDHAALGTQAADEFSVPFITAQEIVDSALAQRILTGCGIGVLQTPGHSGDSLSYVSADGVLLSGDHLLGTRDDGDSAPRWISSTVLALPDQGGRHGVCGDSARTRSRYGRKPWPQRHCLLPFSSTRARGTDSSSSRSRS